MDKNEHNSNMKDKFKFTKKDILRAVAIALVLTTVFFAGFFTHYFTLNKELRSIEFLIDVYKKNYYNVSDKSIVHTIADGILDDYSQYFTAEEYDAYKKEGMGQKKGYGIAISGLDVTRVTGNSPAEACGIKAGGKIVGYKQQSAAEYIIASDNASLIAFLQADHDKVNLKIDYSGNIKEFTLSKAEYLENCVFFSDKNGSFRFNGDKKGMNFTAYDGDGLTLDEGWGYIRFTSFNGLEDGTLGGAGQFIYALQQSYSRGNRKLIIDLRSNGGGYMDILCKIASHLCDSKSSGSFVCQKARYADGSIYNFNAEKSQYGKYEFEKIVFLANANSASASEALMGAVLDYDEQSGNNIVRVVIDPMTIGERTYERTYGKGIMQSFFTNPLTGETVKLTNAEVLWPVSSTSIHGVGLTPALDNRVLLTVGDAVAFAQTL